MATDILPTVKGTAAEAGLLADPAPTASNISIVIPVLDEAETLPVLVGKLLEVAARHELDLRQIILVDDGSRDQSWAVMRRLAFEQPVVTAIQLRRNFGKSTALNVGIEAASGSVIVTMDADLQDDPEELPRFIEALERGYDVISGWKKVRRDPPSKTVPSLLFNRVTAWVSGIELHDFNCGFKAYRREVFDRVELYGELHRFVPVLAHSLGFRIGELVIRHHPRRWGRSKFGARRFLHGFIDLLTVLTITRYARRPGHLFGGVGGLALFAGFSILTYLTGLKFITGADIGTRPLLLLGALAVVVGLQTLLFGILAELINNRTRGVEPRTLIRETAHGAD